MYQKDIQSAHARVVRCIRSCRSEFQLPVAERLTVLFGKQYAGNVHCDIMVRLQQDWVKIQRRAIFLNTVK